MYDSPVCKVGTGVCIIVAGTAISGFWLLGAFLALVLGVVVGARALHKHTVAHVVAAVNSAENDAAGDDKK